MKSIPPVFVRTACGLVVLSALLGASTAAAQGLGVNVQRNGQPVASLEVVFYAASGPKPGTVSENTASFGADVIAASLEGKSATVCVEECQDGRVRVLLVEDGASAPANDGTCRRRRAGAFIIRRGATIVIDVARGPVADTAQRPSPRGLVQGMGLGIGVFGTATPVPWRWCA